MTAVNYHRERIEKLREKAVKPYVSLQEFFLHFYRRYIDNDALLHPELRYADAPRHAFSHAAPSIDEGELIVGKPGARLSPRGSCGGIVRNCACLPACAGIPG